MAYKVQIHCTAQKQVLLLPRDVQAEVASAIDTLATTPRPSGCKKLRETKLWRIRVGRYRVIYSIDDDTRVIIVVKVSPRKENTYKGV